jgi:DUF971 family protein
MRPSSVNLNKQERQLTIVWDDQHNSAYPVDVLREACPCAVCRGGHQFMGKEFDPDLLRLNPSQAFEARDIQLVGNYALQFFWSDGHSAGIYTWEYLRRICPCAECQKAR